MNIKIGDQLYVNGKWYFDVLDVQDGTVVIRIKYKENPRKEVYSYRPIALDANLFTNVQEKSFFKTCNIDNNQFKQVIGSLIDRIAKEGDISKIFEDGMGDVSMPGVNATPGMTGTSGSGDISVFPKSTLGFEIVSKDYKRIRKKMKTKASDAIIKTPVINLTSVKESLEEEESTPDQTDNEYKTLVFDLLDYPTDNDYDVKFIKVINKIRPTFVESSAETIKSYFRNLYTLNKTLIKNKTSEWFQNNILILADSPK